MFLLSSRRTFFRCGVNNCNRRHNKLLHVPRDCTSSNELCAKVKNHERNTLLGEGSTCSMIDNSLADKLNLHVTVAPPCFHWTNNITHFEDTSRKVTVNISADTKKRTFYRLINVRAVGNLSLSNQGIDVERLCRSYPYLDRQILIAV